MPGWHKQLRDQVKAKQVVMLGVVQEQHAERSKLYANWQQLDWPILQDPINLLGCNGVPVTIAIDEHGIVRSTRPTVDWVKNEFLAKPIVAASNNRSGRATQVNLEQQRAAAHAANTAEAWRQLGDFVMLWRPDQASQAVDAYQKALDLSPSARLHFRLGVALRHRSESPSRKPQDFAAAVKQWETALGLDPNQYIWRRRIQQYGPRLDKPYPFYDWVDDAVAEITKRDGKPPAPLRIPLSGAEVAHPVKEAGRQAATEAVSPDPTNRIHRDPGELVQLEPTVVASSNPKRPGFRLHLAFSLSEGAVWNNEAEPIQVWFEESPSVSMAARRLLHEPQVASAESDENRVLDVEFTREMDREAKIRGYALYYICEKSTQQCILRRQDFSIPIRIE